jgi:threonine/homoserine/homoserine lactone efflux protein
MTSVSWSAGTLAQGFLFGMVLQLSVGPVCLGVFERAATGRLRPALWMVAGVALADAICIALALLGTGALLRVDEVRLALGLLGSATLAYFGLRTIRATTGDATARPARVSGRRGSLTYGLALTLTNPLTIVFWGGAFASLAASGALGGAADSAAFAVGCVAATIVLLAGVALSARALGPVLTAAGALVWLNRAVGAFLIAFAIKLALDAIG